MRASVGGARRPFANPLSIRNLKAWYDASDAATITKDGSNLVAQWSDKSGNGVHLLQATAANKPTLTVADQNGLDVVTFADTGSSATSTRMVSSATFNTSNTTFFIVMKRAAAVSTDGVMGGPVGNVTITSTIMEWAAAGSVDGTTALRSADPPVQGTYFILSGRRSAAANNIELRENGAYIKKTTHTGGTTSTAILRVGVDTNSNYINASMGEIIVYDQYLTDAQMLDVENYLNDKWACYTNFEERRDLHRGVQRYCTANAITSVASLPAPKPLYGLFGQSNAAGQGSIASLSNPALSSTITDGLIWNGAAFADLLAGSNNQCDGVNNIGPETSFMYDLAADFGARYLVKYASGGTNLQDKWLPSLPVGVNLYLIFVARIDAARYQQGLATGLQLVPDYFIWWQGESDAANGGSYVANYQANEYAMFTALRQDVVNGESIKLINVKIRDDSHGTEAAAVNAAKVANSVAMANVYMVDAYLTGSNPHADGPSQVKVGNDCALIAGATTQVAA